MNRIFRPGFAAACFLCASLSFGQSAPPAQPEHHHPPLPKATNLQVLPKTISPEELHQTMHGISNALGVHCDFCHVQDPKTKQFDYASDAIAEKGMARTMIAMTQEINSKFMAQINDPDAKPVDKTVTCGTCHRGNTMPEPFVPKQGAEQHNHMSTESH